MKVMTLWDSPMNPTISWDLLVFVKYIVPMISWDLGREVKKKKKMLTRVRRLWWHYLKSGNKIGKMDLKRTNMLKPRKYTKEVMLGWEQGVVEFLGNPPLTHFGLVV